MTASSKSSSATTASHHAPGGGFRNPWPSAQLHGFRDFLKWTLVERRQNPRPPDPDPSSFPVARPAFIAPRATPDALTLTWIGHSSFLLQLAGLNILLDPIWSDRASPVQFAGPRRWVRPGIVLDRLPPIDLVALSHDHYDHLDAGTIRRLTSRYPAAQWLAPLGVAEFLRHRGARDIVERDWWENASLLELEVTCVPAQHFSGRTLGRRNQTLWCGWTFQGRDHRVFFAGDTALHPEFGAITKRLGPFDLAILPIGAYEPRWFMGTVHMNPDDCIKAVAQIKPFQNGKRLVVTAGHWGTFKLTDEPMDEPPARMREGWVVAGHAADDLWIMKHGETRALED
ncbi:MAG TPA: MBL fold metallo-hydrolase [Gemmatimonadaceae bacterium]|jgi:N-acyl-phosphatidylethanolamine-hydrolysing phospholipase D|nr:MBL fold metallo-hydrolase [Gemmatimonadaceae bacterium]